MAAGAADLEIIYTVEAIEVMGPDKLIAGSGSGRMGGAGDQAETGCVRASEL